MQPLLKIFIFWYRECRLKKYSQSIYKFQAGISGKTYSKTCIGLDVRKMLSSLKTVVYFNKKRNTKKAWFQRQFGLSMLFPSEGYETRHHSSQWIIFALFLRQITPLCVSWLHVVKINSFAQIHFDTPNISESFYVLTAIALLENDNFERKDCAHQSVHQNTFLFSVIEKKLRIKGS